MEQKDEIILQANAKVTKPVLVSEINKHETFQEEEFKKLI
jgi:hypothetical protein